LVIFFFNYLWDYLINKIIKQQKMNKFVCFLANLFNRHNIKYWADFGTLLGIVRDKNVISWDNDVDFSILQSECFKIYPIIGDILANNTVGYVKCHHVGAFKIFFKGQNWHCDIYPWIIDGQIVKHPQKCFGLPTFPTYEIEDLILTDFNNIKIKIPIHYENRLVRLYGDWKTPRKPRKNQKEYWDGDRINNYKQRNPNNR